jgi:serine/threonine protein kinase
VGFDVVSLMVYIGETGSTGQLPLGQGLYGSAAYMSPEQIKACLQRRQGLPRGPLQGPAADCWGLGLTIYELLTGQTLFGVSNEAPAELWTEMEAAVEAAREYHERELAAEHEAWV